MAKLNKMYYYKKDGEKKLNCYYIAIPKEVIYDTDIKDNMDLKVYAEENKIIIEKNVDKKY